MNNRLNILNKIAQQVQQVFPGMFYKAPEKIAPHSVSSGPTPYWECYLCGDPVLKKDGSPISDPEDVLYWEKAKIKEEATPSYTLDAAFFIEFKNDLLSYLAFLDTIRDTAFAMLDREIPMFFDKIKFEITEWKAAHPGENPDMYSFIYSLKELFNDFKNRMYDILNGLYDDSERLKNINKKLKLMQHTKALGDNEHRYGPANSLYQCINGLGTNMLYHFLSIRTDINDLNNYNVNEFIEENKYAVFEPYIIKPKKDMVAAFINGIDGIISSGESYKETQKQTMVVKYPICDKCGENVGIKCDYPGCLNRSSDVDDFAEVEHDSGGRNIVENFCLKSHGYKCNGCHKFFCQDETLNDNNEYKYDHDGDSYCSECYDELYTECEECYDVVDSNYAYWDEENNKTLCRACYENNESGTVKGEDLKTAKKVTKSVKDYYPIDQQVIEQKIIPNLKTAIGKNVPGDKLIEWLDKRNVFGANKAIINAALLTELGKGKNVEQVLQVFQDQLVELARWKSEYPGFSKSPKLMPLTIKIESANTGSGTVFALYPNDTLFAFAESLIPGAKEAYDNYIKRTGHHKGALAYARVRIDNSGNIIVNNLQTDIDTHHFIKQKGMTREDINKNKALKWWLKVIDDFWTPYMLDFLKRLGASIGKPVYLTPFKLQKKKWSTISDEGASVYDLAPERMGFGRETINTHPEMLRPDSYEMTRIARLYYGCVKIIGLNR